MLYFMSAMVAQTKSVCLQCGRPRFDPWVGKIPWRRKWQPTPAVVPGESHGGRSLVGYNPWGCKESDTTERLHFHFQCYALYFPGGSDDKESACQCRRPGFDPWVRKIPWRRKWQPNPVFLPGESHGQRSLVGYSPRGRKESDTTWRLHFIVFV